MKSNNRRFTINQMITLKQTLSMKAYLDTVSSIPVITPQREVELSAKIKEGSQDALDELVCANLRFVISVAKKYQNQGLTLEDLIGEGNLGLIRAAHRFDPTRGFKFITCALWWIRQAITESLTVNGRTIRLSLNRINDMGAIKKVINEFHVREDREPSFSEIVKETGLTDSRVSMSLKAVNSIGSLDEPIGGEDFTIGETISDNSFKPDSGLYADERVDGVSVILRTLSPREKAIIELTFGIGSDEKTIEEISEKMGIGKERIRQIREEALRKLRGGPRGKFLRKFH